MLNYLMPIYQGSRIKFTPLHYVYLASVIGKHRLTCSVTDLGYVLTIHMWKEKKIAKTNHQ